MNKQTIAHAKKVLFFLINDGEIQDIIEGQDGESLYIELPSGKNIRIHDDEIKHLALEYLKSEKQRINNN